MKRLLMLPILIVLLSCSQTPPPNFVVIFCDDLGYGDIGCFGSTVHKTPNIDQIAANGMRMTHFYSSSGVCSPSRASLMTGCYPRRVDLHVDEHDRPVLFPIGKKGLNPDETTIAEILQNQGYATACIGKWHLGDQSKFLPTRHGFDVYYGIPYSNDMGIYPGYEHRPKLPLLEGETVIEAPVEQETITRRYTEAALAFIDAYAEQPFFLYLPHTMPHHPVNAGEKFRGTSKNGLYGDAVQEIDWSTGQILQKLDELGLTENTLVLFTSDNGAAQKWGGSNLPLRGWKGSTWEGGQRIPAVVQWPGTIPAGVDNAHLSSTLDILPTFAAWAGGALPEETIDGVDIRSILLEPEIADSPRQVFYYYQKGQLQAVRSGRWKLHLPLQNKIRNWGDGLGPQEAQLYDLAADIDESENLVAKLPDVVNEILQLAEQARAELGDLDRRGSGQRPAGWVETAKPLQKP